MLFRFGYSLRRDRTIAAYASPIWKHLICSSRRSRLEIPAFLSERWRLVFNRADIDLFVVLDFYGHSIRPFVSFDSTTFFQSLPSFVRRIPLSFLRQLFHSFALTIFRFETLNLRSRCNGVEDTRPFQDLKRSITASLFHYWFSGQLKVFIISTILRFTYLLVSKTLLDFVLYSIQLLGASPSQEKYFTFAMYCVSYGSYVQFQ